MLSAAGRWRDGNGRGDTVCEFLASMLYFTTRRPRSWSMETSLLPRKKSGSAGESMERRRFRFRPGRSPSSRPHGALRKRASRRKSSTVAYSYDPALARPPKDDITADVWEGLRTIYAQRAPLFLAAALPGLDPAVVRFVPHHVAHAAPAYLAGPFKSCSVMVLDGRGEDSSYLAGRSVNRKLDVLATQALPHSLGLLYEEATAHLGFRRSSDEYKVMALASYGKPTLLQELRSLVTTDGAGGFVVQPIEWGALAKRRDSDDEWGPSTQTWPAACKRGFKRCFWSSPGGCTLRPATTNSSWPVVSR